jgi:hypothetical protein
VRGSKCLGGPGFGLISCGAVRILISVPLLLLSLAATPASGAADDLLEQLATCQVSWLDWKDDPAQGRKFGEAINAAFTPQPRSPNWTPKKPVVVGGLKVVEAFPESVGMAVGFSLTVDANFDTARAAFEKLAGKKFETCESGDGMKSCELRIAEKKTMMIVAGDNGKSKTTLLGCYYFYAQ